MSVCVIFVYLRKKEKRIYTKPVVLLLLLLCVQC